jgi:hypothetical protein
MVFSSCSSLPERRRAANSSSSITPVAFNSAGEPLNERFHLIKDIMPYVFSSEQLAAEGDLLDHQKRRCPGR